MEYKWPEVALSEVPFYVNIYEFCNYSTFKIHTVLTYDISCRLR